MAKVCFNKQYILGKDAERFYVSCWIIQLLLVSRNLGVVLSYRWLSGCVWLKPVQPLARACLLVHLFVSCCCLFVRCVLLCCHIGGCLVALGWNKWRHWPQLIAGFPLLILLLNFNIHTLSPLFNPSQTVKWSHKVQLTRKVLRSSVFPSVRPSRGGMRLRQRRLELLWRRGRMSWHRTPGD